MKNYYIRTTVQFILVFSVASSFYVAFSAEDNLPIWERSIGDYLLNVLGVVLFGMIFFLTPFLLITKREGDKHKKYHEKYSIPYANDKGQCYCDSKEAADAFLNPHDPILNPQPHKPEKA
jgi:hypothetical protein